MHKLLVFLHWINWPSFSEVTGQIGHQSENIFGNIYFKMTKTKPNSLECLENHGLESICSISDLADSS